MAWCRGKRSCEAFVTLCCWMTPRIVRARGSWASVCSIRHFLVPDREPATTPAKGSLAECVRFSGSPPAWLARLLNDIRRSSLRRRARPSRRSRSWITRAGYWRERRGGRFAQLGFSLRASSGTPIVRAACRAEAATRQLAARATKSCGAPGRGAGAARWRRCGPSTCRSCERVCAGDTGA